MADQSTPSQTIEVVVVGVNDHDVWYRKFGDDRIEQMAMPTRTERDEVAARSP